MKHRTLERVKISKDIQAAIETVNLFDDALSRAQAGEKWLDHNAPPYWRLTMISAHDGHLTSQVNMCIDVENPLALAFRHDKRFSNRPTWEDVRKVFFDGQRDHEAALLGFIEKETRVGDTVIPGHIDARYLNAAWEEVLGNFSHHSLATQLANALAHS